MIHDAPNDDEPPQAALPAFLPVPRLMDRHNGWKPDVQRRFIEALAETGSVKAACRRVARSDHGAYMLRRHPEATSFRAAWDAALDLGVRRIEDAAMDRALYGTEETIHYHGEHIATRRRYNERLVMFILRNRAPERFTEGKPRGMNAIDKMELTRLRNQWRKQWEQEWGAEQLKKEVATMASINAKIDLIRAKEEHFESPRVRALRDALDDAIEEDRENRYNPLADPAHELYRGAPPAHADEHGGEAEGDAGSNGVTMLYEDDEEAENAGPGPSGMVFNGPIPGAFLFPSPHTPTEPPEQSAGEPPERPGGPRVWTLKDERWRGR